MFLMKNVEADTKPMLNSLNERDEAGKSCVKTSQCPKNIQEKESRTGDGRAKRKGDIMWDSPNFW